MLKSSGTPHADAGIHVAPHLGRLRISPHVYNDEEDVDRFVGAFRRLMDGRAQAPRAT